MESLNFVIDADCAPAIAALRAASDGIDALAGKTASVGIQTSGGARAMGELNAISAAREAASGDVRVGVDTTGITAAREHIGDLRSDVRGMASDLDSLGGSRRIGFSDTGALRGLVQDASDLTSGLGSLSRGGDGAAQAVERYAAASVRASDSSRSMNESLGASERAHSDMGRAAERSSAAHVTSARDIEMAYSGATARIEEHAAATQRAHATALAGGAGGIDAPTAPAGGQFNNRRMAGEAQVAREAEAFLKREAERGVPGTPDGPPITPVGGGGGGGGSGGSGGGRGAGGRSDGDGRSRLGHTAMNVAQMGVMVGAVGEMVAGAAGLLSVNEVIKNNRALTQGATTAMDQFNWAVQWASAGAEAQGIPAMRALGSSLGFLGTQVGATGTEHLGETLAGVSKLAVDATGALRDMDPAIGPAITGLTGLADAVTKGISSPNSVSAIKAVGDSLSDPGTQKGFENLTGGAMTAAGTVTAAASDALGLVGRIPGMGQDAAQGPMVAGGLSAWLGARKGGGLKGGLKGGAVGAGLEMSGELLESQGASPLWGIGGAALGAVLGTLLPIPGVGTMAGGAIGGAVGTGAGLLFGGGGKDKAEELGLTPDQSKQLTEMQQAFREGLTPSELLDPKQRHEAAQKSQGDALAQQAAQLGISPQQMAEQLGMSQEQAKKIVEMSQDPGGTISGRPGRIGGKAGSAFGSVSKSAGGAAGGGGGGGGGTPSPVIGAQGAQGWSTGGGGGGDASGMEVPVIGQEGAQGWYMTPPGAGGEGLTPPTFPQWDQAEWDRSPKQAGQETATQQIAASPGGPVGRFGRPGPAAAPPHLGGGSAGGPGSRSLEQLGLQSGDKGGRDPGPPAPDYAGTWGGAAGASAGITPSDALGAIGKRPQDYGPDAGWATGNPPTGPAAAGHVSGPAAAGSGQVGTPGTGIGTSPGLSGVAAPDGGWPAPTPGFAIGSHPTAPAPPAGPPVAPGAPPQSVQDLTWMGPTLTTEGMAPGWGQGPRGPAAPPGMPAAPGAPQGHPAGPATHGPAPAAPAAPTGVTGVGAAAPVAPAHGTPGQSLMGPANVAAIQGLTQAMTQQATAGRNVAQQNQAVAQSNQAVGQTAQTAQNATSAQSQSQSQNTNATQSNTNANAANAQSNQAVTDSSNAAATGVAGLGQAAAAASPSVGAVSDAAAAAPASMGAAVGAVAGAAEGMGSAMGTGMAAGIADSSPAADAAAASAASSAGDSASSAAGEESPSKVWHQIGVYMPAGMALGITAAAPMAASAAAGAVMHTSSVAALYAADAGLKVGFLYGTNIISGMTSVLDTQALKAAGLAQGVDSPLAKIALGQLGLLGAAGGGAQSWDLHKAGLVSFDSGTPAVKSGGTPTVQIHLTMDGQVVRTISQNVLWENFEELLTAVGTARR